MNSKPKRYTCSKCGYETDFIVHLKDHTCSIKTNSLNSSGQEIKNTSSCSVKTYSLNPLGQETKNTSSSFKCSECGYSCRSTGLLKLHQNIHYKGFYKCSLCSYVTNFENLFKIHSEKHEKCFNKKNGDYEHLGKQNGRYEDLGKQNGGYKELDKLNGGYEDLGKQKGDYEDLCKQNGNYEDLCKQNGLNNNSDSCSNSQALNDSEATEEQYSKSPPYDFNSIITSLTYRTKKYCPYCTFITRRIKTYGNHLIRSHRKEISLKVAQFKQIKDRRLNLRVLNSQEIAVLVDFMEGSIKNNNIVNKKFKNALSKNVTKLALSKAITKLDINRVLEKINVNPKITPRKMSWTLEEKREIFWCDTFARNSVFEKIDISKRRRKALETRGIIDPKKLSIAPNTLLHSMTLNVRIGKSTVTTAMAMQIVKDVENYVRSKVKMEKREKIKNKDLELLFDFKNLKKNKINKTKLK